MLLCLGVLCVADDARLRVPHSGRRGHELCFSEVEVRPAQLSAKLDEIKRTHFGAAVSDRATPQGAQSAAGSGSGPNTPWSDPFRWIDFCGHSPSALNVLANDYNLPAKLLHGIEFTSKPKVWPSLFALRLV